MARRPAIHGIERNRAVECGQPTVAPIFEAYTTQVGVADRVRFVAGDFFNDPIPAAR